MKAFLGLLAGVVLTVSLLTFTGPYSEQNMSNIGRLGRSLFAIITLSPRSDAEINRVPTSALPRVETTEVDWDRQGRMRDFLARVINPRVTRPISNDYDDVYGTVVFINYAIECISTRNRLRQEAFDYMTARLNNFRTEEVEQAKREVARNMLNPDFCRIVEESSLRN
jgi:hypothetical protein